MLASQIPAKFPIPFAASAGIGQIRTIPTASQISITPGAASLTDGFPPLNFIPVPAGGVPPFGQDMNGILNEITANQQWLQAGGLPVYDSVFSAAIGGYPNGAVLRMANSTGLWVSTADNNTTNPDSSGAGWIALATSKNSYLDLSVAGAANVTLTAVQSDYTVIDLFGAITANINVIVPTAAGSWTFNNSTTGAFTVTVKTAAGTGVVIPQGTALPVWCDAVNVASSTSGATTTVITAASDPTFANSSANAASTNWVRGAMSAIATAAGFAASLAVNGYVKLPSWLGGVVFQWGTTASIASSGSAVTTFPIAFPSACQSVLITQSAAGGAAQAQSCVSAKSTMTFTAINSASNAQSFYWMAVGY